MRLCMCLHYMLLIAALGPSPGLSEAQLPNASRGSIIARETNLAALHQNHTWFLQRRRWSTPLQPRHQ